MHEFYFAQKAFVKRDGQLLLVQKSQDDPFNPGKWEVPGGRMKFGEDVDSHLKREVREEVGIEVKPGRPFHVWQWQLRRDAGTSNPVNIQIVAVARLCEALTLEFDLSGRADDDYLGAVRWVPYSEVEGLDLIQNMEPVVEAFLRLPEVAP